MDPVHREVLEVNHDYLVECVAAADILPRLVKDEIVNDEDVGQLKRTEGQGPRAVSRLLLLTLRRRGSYAYAALHRALRETGLEAVCEVLLDTELALRDGLAAEGIGLYPPNTQHTAQGLASSSTEDRETPRDPETPVATKADSPSRDQREAESQGREAAHDQQEFAPPTDPSPTQEDADKENRIKELEQEVSKLRRSQDIMEAHFREELQKLEQGQKSKEKGGGCAVM